MQNSQHVHPVILLWGSARHFRSSAVPLLYKPTTKTRFADRVFRCTAPTIWNFLAIDVTSSCSLTVLKSRFKAHIFRQTFNLSD